MNEKLPVQIKAFLATVYLASLATCLYSLYNVSSTEPGVIPSLTMHGTLPDQRKWVAEKKRSYYALYKTEEELEETMAELGLR